MARGCNVDAGDGEENSMESLPNGHSKRESAVGSGGPVECNSTAPDFRPEPAANDTRMSQLARTIEAEIIPRLMLAHRASAEPPGPLSSDPSGYTITDVDVREFAKLVVAHDEDIAFSSIERLRRRDVSVDQLYLDLLAPTARYLGTLWDDDLCSFTDVTVGLGRLQRVLRELSPALGHSVEHPALGRRVLLLPSPGEQHTFGLVMVGEFFRRAGWDVTGGAGAAGADAATLVAAEWFDAVGFSLGTSSQLPALTAAIVAVRHATCNQGIAVLVGGPMFSLHPELAAQVGAEGGAIDGREAPNLAERLITAGMQRLAPRP
jgi:methanogenic corrinoid protein MtbC1